MTDFKQKLERMNEAFNEHDAEAAAAQYAEDAIVRDPQYTQPLCGRDAIAKDLAEFFRAFPDVHNEVCTVVVSDGIGASEYKVKGTHDGPLTLPTGEFPATHKPIEFDVGVFIRLNDAGEIVEEHRYYDVADQMNQLGLS